MTIRMADAAEPTPQQTHADGWANVITGLGTSRDKRKGALFVRDGISRDRSTLENLYAGDDMAARIVDALPDEMTREWIELSIEDTEQKKATNQALETLDARANIRLAMIWARLFGGSCVLLGIDDGQEVSQPLNEDAIKSFKFMTVLDRFSLSPGRPYGDPLSPKFGKPEYYEINPQISSSGTEPTRFGLRVHESRFLRLDSGVTVTPTSAQQNETWADSVLERVSALLPDFHAIFGGTAHLVQDFSQGVYKLKGLASMLAAGADANVIKRLQMVDMSRSIVRAIVLDADGEDFTRDVAALSGLSELVEKWEARLAAAARMPVSILMGRSPSGGLSATGEMEIRYWYDHVRSQQESSLRAQIEKLLRLLFKAKDGPTRGVEPESWSFDFRALWQPSDAEKVELRNKQAQSDAVYIQNGVVTPEEIAASRFGGDRYSFETQLDAESRDAFEASDETTETTEVAPGEQAVQETALNGAQVSSLLEVVSLTAAGGMPRDTAVGVLVRAFNMSPEEASRLLGSVGKNFEPTVIPNTLTQANADPAASQK